MRATPYGQFRGQAKWRQREGELEGLAEEGPKIQVYSNKY
jgi:hypothetical protein